MPNKKKKYNARFPPARIKKIMQMDEDVGKVAAPVPVIISRALELFMESLLSKTHTYTQDRNAKTLSAAHIKQVIQAEPSYDFLRDLVANIPDVQPEEEGSIVGSGGVATLRRSSSVQGREGGGKDSKGGRGRGKRGRPRKQPQHTDGARSEEDEEVSDNSMDGDSGHDGYAGHDDAIATAFHHQQQQPHLSSSTTNAADLLSLGMQSAGIPSAQDEGHETQQQSIAALAHPQPFIAHTTHPTDVYESSKLPSDVHATHTSDMHKLATSLSSEHNHGMQMPTNRIVAMDNPILHSKATIPLPVKKEQATVQSSTGVMSEGDPHIPTSSISQPLRYPDDSNAADMRATSSATPIPFSGSTCTQPTSLPDNHMLQVMHGTLPQQPLPVHTAKPHHTLAKEQTSTMASTADTNESHSEQHATSSHYSAPVLEGTSQHNASKPFSSLLPHDHKEHHMLSTSSSGHLPPQHPQIKMEASPTAENLSIAKIPGSNGMYSTVAAHSPSPPAAHLSAASVRYHASPHVVSGMQPPARPPPGAFIRSPVPPYYHISSSSPTAQHPSSIANNHPPTHIDNLASSATGPRMLAGESMSALHHHHRHPYAPLMSPHDDRDQPLQLTTTQPHVAHQPPRHHHDTHSEPLQLTTNHRSKPTDAQYFDNCQPEDLSKPQQR